MASIREIGPHQWRVEIRRKGVKVKARTFETRKEASDYATIMEGKVVGGEYVGPTLASTTTVLQALEWYETAVIPRKPRSARNKKVYVKYWKATDFAQWRMGALMPWDLVEWRVGVLDEDSADDDDTQVGPDAIWAPQTCWHHLQLISHLFVEWGLAHKVKIDNPVSKHVRPILDDGRDRRLDHAFDDDQNDERARLLKTVDASNSKWLGAATRIALETCMRQAELSGLTWGRVRLDVTNPFVDLPKTKNDRPRRVPLSKTAIGAIKMLTEKSASTPILGIETPRAIGHAFRGVVMDEDFPDLRWHDLRHEGISRLFEMTDLRDQEIMAMVGHLSVKSLQRYTHLRTDKFGPRLG